MGFEEGIISLAAQDIFRRKLQLEEKDPLASIEVEVSYLEIYMEECYDLLVSNSNSPQMPQKLDVIERNNSTVADGLTSLRVQSVAELLSILSVSAKNRATGKTLMNAESSR